MEKEREDDGKSDAQSGQRLRPDFRDAPDVDAVHNIVQRID